MMIKETVHHGNYRNVRVVELPEPPTMGDLAKMVSECPYAVTPSATALMYAVRSRGSLSHGWVDWEVVR